MFSEDIKDAQIFVISLQFNVLSSTSAQLPSL